MSLLINRIKQDQVQARKDRKHVAIDLLTTLIGEAEAVGKSARNGIPTDDEVVAVVKKFSKGVNETMGYIGDTNPEALRVLQIELSILNVYLPVQLTSEDIEKILMEYLNGIIPDAKTKGAMMKFMKDNHSGKYDGKLAAEIVNSIIEKVRK